MPTRWHSVVIDAAEPARLARWWADALGWRVTHEDDDEVDIASGAPGAIEWVFVPVADPKHGKNRVHLDLAPTPGEDHAAAVARLESMGARRADVGQHEVPWVVLADPEGNEFCVLTPR